MQTPDETDLRAARDCLRSFESAFPEDVPGDEPDDMHGNVWRAADRGASSLSRVADWLDSLVER